MKKKLILAMAIRLAMVLTPSVAHADCPANVAPEPDKAEQDYKGVHGVWFHLEVARCLAGDVKELAKLRADTIPKLELRIKETDEAMALIREQLKLSVAEGQAASKAIEAAVRGRREAEEDMNAWYRSATFLIGMGVLATVVVEVALVLVFRGLATN